LIVGDGTSFRFKFQNAEPQITQIFNKAVVQSVDPPEKEIAIVLNSTPVALFVRSLDGFRFSQSTP